MRASMAKREEDRGSEDWARLLKANWEERASSEARDFFVASHPGWNEPARWQRQAEIDVELMLHGIDRASLLGMNLLEIGCGVGRLVPSLAPLLKSYTGFDIASGMIAEAKRRSHAQTNARFFESDGALLPKAARDRQYELIIALAVFIHCPETICASLIQSAYRQLAPGSQLRFQVLADPTDPDGLEDYAASQASVKLEGEVLAMEAQASGPARELIEGKYYMGKQFRFAEAEQFLCSLTDGEVKLFRLDPGHIYAWIERPA